MGCRRDAPIASPPGTPCLILGGILAALAAYKVADPGGPQRTGSSTSRSTP